VRDYTILGILQNSGNYSVLNEVHLNQRKCTWTKEVAAFLYEYICNLGMNYVIHSVKIYVIKLSRILAFFCILFYEIRSKSDRVIVFSEISKWLSVFGNFRSFPSMTYFPSGRLAQLLHPRNWEHVITSFTQILHHESMNSQPFRTILGLLEPHELGL
jgi:hypothetical protein